MKVAIIGSGPAAFATLITLLTESEYQITIFDADAWLGKSSKGNPEALKSKTGVRKGNVDLEQNIDVEFNWNGKFKNLIPSNQKSGGWSNFWGATLLQNKHLNRKEIDLHVNTTSWKVLLKYLPAQGEQDSLDDFFPLLGSETPHGRVSGVAEALLDNFTHHTKNEKSIVFGKSRLAINPLEDNIEKGCISCGKCLSGCPNQHIFNSWNAILQLRKDFNLERISFSKSGYVSKFHESAEGNVFIETIDGKIHNGFSKIYIAAGPIATATLVQRSLSIQEVALYETPMTIIPSIYLGKLGPESTQITLSEIFMAQFEKMDIASAGQIYSFNDELLRIISKKFKVGILRFLLPKFLQSRIIFCMFFITPTIGSEIVIKFNSGVGLIDFKGRYKYSEFKGQLLKYAKQMKNLGFLTFPLLSYRSPKGSSFHYGSLHLVNKPKTMLVRKNGTLIRLRADSKIFCVGSSGFPKLNPGPITLDIMMHSQIVTRRSLSGTSS